MKNLEVALCDTCEDYIVKFASYLMENMEASIHIFTTSESFFADEGDYDICIMTKEFDEVSQFRPKGKTGRKYFLTEEQEEESEDYIFKYQSIDCILERINELKEKKNLGASIKKSDSKSKLIGVYSPVSHELQLPFAMALGQAHRTKGKVLFLDLEEISILPNLVGNSCERNLLDLLYEINTNTTKINLDAYAKSFLGFDYIEPFVNPNEIAEIDSDVWSHFFEMLLKSDYDAIVVLFGKAISGFAGLIEMLDKLYVLGRPGDYFKKSQNLFFDYLERIQSGVERENVILPMSANNLSDDTYQIEELLEGNLGVFVRKLLDSNGKNAKEY